MLLAPVILAGLGAGAIHVLSGPDHLAAVLPLASARPVRAWRVGATWGVGHGVGVLALGALGQLFKASLDLDRLSAWSELGVGLLLVGLGIWALWRSRLLVVHSHGHDHDHHHHPDHAHPHIHLADPTVGSSEHRQQGRHGAHLHSAFGFGLLHGSAGAGHIFGVLPSLGMPPLPAGIYLGTYVLAAVISMSGAALLMGSLGGRLLPARGLMRGAGAFSLLVGAFWVSEAALALA